MHDNVTRPGRTTLGLFALAVLLALPGCADKLLPADQGNPSGGPGSGRYDTTIISNGFRVSGDGYNDVPFALSDKGSVTTAGTDRATIIEVGIVSRPGGRLENVIALLRIPRSCGTFAWANQTAQPTDSSSIFATIMIDGKQYVSIEGTTTVAFYRDVAKNMVSGTFEGRLGSAFGDTIVVGGGRFEAVASQP